MSGLDHSGSQPFNQDSALFLPFPPYIPHPLPPPFPSLPRSPPSTQDRLPPRQPSLPHLHPMMKYSPLSAHLQTGPSVARATQLITHQDDGPMGISITYSRHIQSHPPTALPSNKSRSYHDYAATWARPNTNRLSSGRERGLTNDGQVSQRYTALVLSRPEVLKPRNVGTGLSGCLPDDDQRNSHHDNQTNDTHSAQTADETLHSPGLADPRRDPLPFCSARPRARSQSQPSSVPWPSSSLAPHSVRAVLVHRLKPITTATILRGRRIGPLAH